MKLSKVLHLEIAKGKRGPKHMRNGLNDMLNSVVEVNGNFTAIEHRDIFADPILLFCIAMIKRFLKSDGKNYYFSKDFITLLSSMDRKLPVEYLPEKFFGYFVFPDNVLFDDTNANIVSAYVYVGKVKHYGWVPNNREERKPLDPEDKVISVAYCDSKMEMGKILFHCKADTKMSDLIFENGFLCDFNSIEVLDSSTNSETLLIACLNAVLYITSEDPDLTNIVPELKLKDKVRKKQRKKTNWENLCTESLILVNHKYKDECRYNVDSAWWSTHPRWQQCGPNNSMVKLIWVKGHEKKLGNKE